MAGSNQRGGPPVPASPDLPARLRPAEPDFSELEDEDLLERREVSHGWPGQTADLVEFVQCRFQRADLSGSVLRRARFTDCQLSHTSLATLRAEQATLQRSELSACRLTGMQWLDGALRDVVISQCRADLASFRFSTLAAVRFEACNLAGADFTQARLGGAEFVDCDLTGAQFSHADLAGARLRRCELAGIGGVTSLRGAILAEQDLVGLSYALAEALGIEFDPA